MKSIIKKIILSISILSMFGCAGYTYNGIQFDEMKNMNKKEVAQFAAGFLTTFAVHTAGHLLYLESIDKDWHIKGKYEYIDDPITDSQLTMFGRTGFISQLAVGYTNKFFFKSNNYFWKGYNTGTIAEIALYPLTNERKKSDLYDIDRNSNGGIEYLLYTGLAANLLIDKEK